MLHGEVWRPRPVFVTGTFRDMHAEREHLANVVFPALAERLRERCHHLEGVDLRWGIETVSVADESAREINVLKVCLSEIARSRPFLIGLIGDRYGWVPPPERAQAAGAEAGLEFNIPGASVTELEIEFGLLHDPESAAAAASGFAILCRMTGCGPRSRHVTAIGTPVTRLRLRGSAN